MAFNPAQPRVPKGNPDGGQWSDAARAAAKQVRDVHKRALKKFLPLALTMEGRQKLYRMSEKVTTRYQAASSIRYARQGQYTPAQRARMAKQAAAFTALQRTIGKKK